MIVYEQLTDGVATMARETKSNFLSYAHADSAFALKLANSLRVAHANIWIDQLDIPAGNRWDVAIEKALKDTNNLILILTKAAVSSDNVMDEVSYTLEVGKTIFPVLVEECDVPFRLRRLQFIDFTAGYEKGLARLLTALGVDGQELPEPAAIDKTVIVAVGNSRNFFPSWLLGRTAKQKLIVVILLATSVSFIFVESIKYLRNLRLW